MRYLYIYLLLTVGSILGSSTVSAQDCSDVFTAYRDATVYIHVERTTKLTGAVKDFNGTGILVSPYGYVLTNNHVVEKPADVDSVALTGAVGSNANPMTRMLTIARDPSQDLALLQIANSDIVFKFVPVDFSRIPMEGSPLCSMGFPMEQDLLIIKGILSSKIGDNGWWLTDMPVNPGDSGAPVFDSSTKIVAVVVGGISNAQNLNFMIPIFLARPILGYIPPGPSTSSQTTETKTSGLLGIFRGSKLRSQNLTQMAQIVGGDAKSADSTTSGLPIRSATIQNGFQFFEKSTFDFQTNSQGSWDANDADLGAATPTGQTLSSFFVFFDAPPYTSTKGSQGTPAHSGIIETGASNLDDVTECPSSEYRIHYFQPQRGKVYCLRTRDGRHFAKIKITEITADRISFDYMYQPSGSRKFK
jgi:Trypsin-like peptidase domain